MSVKLTGAKKLIVDIEKHIGKLKMQQLSDRALKKGAEVFVRELKSQFESFKDTGATIDEMTISEPMWENGFRTIKIHWKGPKDRYRIIHLNEFGTVKNPNPKGKGAIAKAMRSAEKEYRNTIKRVIKEGI
ncbi:HK97-gp10 family putative phage morphogenesis protein [Peribacillus sp. NPDC076916]|uniref:HK97-gp10 family putative phage morphogenesis protein n=1 Tax=Peribacillus sp. NPDC076916 TaxID=3390608 RepID=UPI003CFFADA0